MKKNITVIVFAGAIFYSLQATAEITLPGIGGETPKRPSTSFKTSDNDVSLEFQCFKDLSYVSGKKLSTVDNFGEVTVNPGVNAGTISDFLEKKQIGILPVKNGEKIEVLVLSENQLQVAEITQNALVENSAADKKYRYSAGNISINYQSDPIDFYIEDWSSNKSARGEDYLISRPHFRKPTHRVNAHQQQANIHKPLLTQWLSSNLKKGLSVKHVIGKLELAQMEYHRSNTKNKHLKTKLYSEALTNLKNAKNRAVRAICSCRMVKGLEDAFEKLKSDPDVPKDIRNAQCWTS